MDAVDIKTIPQGYKQSDLGLIPNDWDVKELGNIVIFKNGKAHENFINNDGSYIVVNSKFISSEGEVVKHSDKQLCPAEKDSILMVMSDVPSGKAIAKCFFVEKSGKYTINQRICSFYPKISPLFLYYKINRNPYFLAFDDGVKQTNLRKSEVLACEIAIPNSISEQDNISKVLSDIDSLIQKTEKLIEKKKAVLQGTAQELISGKRRLPKYNQTWEEVTLGDVAELSKGRGLSKNDIINNGKYKCIHYGELFIKYKEKIVKILSRTNLKTNMFLSKKNDVLMPTSDVTPNGLATASCILEDNVVLGGDILVIRPQAKLNGIFLSYAVSLNRSQVMQLVKGITVYHLYASDMKKFKFNLPEITEQKDIITILDSMNQEIEQLEKKLVKYNQIKQGAMQVLLTGKIRLNTNPHDNPITQSRAN